MTSVSHLITYIVLFISLYFEVFVLITYLEHRDSIKEETNSTSLTPSHFPSVCIIVPCWNEEHTIRRTIDSLLALEYPREKLEILVVDDGSTDGTWTTIQALTTDSRVRVFHKENGGKHTALNFALTQSQSELVGCLDADSYVDPHALMNIVHAFETDPQAMAVTPSVKIWQPKNILEMMQSAEYVWAIFLRKMLALLGAMYVTPGPFSIFKRKVFTQIGPYREAHKTEDMELAMRMQKNQMKIVNAHNAVVYTSAPTTVHKLYTQRVRWTYGFVKNIIDYRFMFFKKEYGNLGIFIMPVAIISIVATLYAATVTVLSLGDSILTQIIKIRTVGFHLPVWSFSIDWFSVNTGLIAIISAMAFIGTLTIVLLSRKMAHGKINFGMDIVYFFALYSFIAPFWMAKAVYNTLFSVTTHWR